MRHGPRPFGAEEWVLWMTGRWQVLKQSNRRQPRPTDAAMAEAGRPVLLPGRLDHTSPSGFSAVDGCPGEHESGKADCRTAASLAYAEGAVAGASPVDATQ
jgi:hypothetical protein